MVDVHPVQVFGFTVRDVRVGITMAMRNDGVVTPRAVVVAEDVDDAEMFLFDADLFPRFTFGGSDGVFVRVERAAGKSPRAASVRPCRAELEKYVRLG